MDKIAGKTVIQYSPDLTPSDFLQFSKFKQAISIIYFRLDDDVIHAVEDFLNSQEGVL